MRWFWLAIAALAAAGLWFVLAPTTQPDAHPIINQPADPPADEPAVAPSPSPTPAPTPAPTPTPTPATPPPSAATTPPADTRSPNDTVRRIDDRTIELDGRFRVIGNGRSDDPYRISWELLTSASQYVDAAKGALTPPPWVRLLDGTYIELSGYYSTAVRTPIARNLLLTLNRWDGCCIGVPPTPFDAIDISMREPIAMQGLHLTRFGTFRGHLTVAPFATGGFLLGLYKLDDTTFETK